VLVKTIRHLPEGRHAVFTSTEPFTRWVQTFTLVDIVHSAVGLIPSPLGTTFTQVATRVIQVWLIWYTFPETTATSVAFTALLLAWSIADTVRYIYLAANLHGKAPEWLIWLR
jgi:very-long-chain (3R)-3-hydroxyacyl-CoA dehydratase